MTTEKIYNMGSIVIGAVLEHNAKIKQTNEISKRVRNYINDLGFEIKEFILNQNLDQYKGKIDWYYEEYSQIILKHLESIDETGVTREKLNGLVSKIGEVIREIDQVFEKNLDFYTENVHPVLIAAVTLEIATHSELNNRCGEFTSQLFILNSMDYQLRKIFIFMGRKYDKNIKRYRGGKIRMNHPYHTDFELYKSLVKNRKYLEHMRYLLRINLNHQFKFTAAEEVPIYNDFNFDRCPNYSVVEVENNMNALALNNKGGNLDNPSIMKDVYDISSKSHSMFTVSLKSALSNRKVQLAIYEIASGEPINAVYEDITVDVEWVTKSINYEKQKEDTFLKFEVSWFDKSEINLFINHLHIDFTLVEHPVPDIINSEKLPFPDYVTLNNRSTNKEVFFHIDNNYSSSLCYTANDVKKNYDMPSLFFDLPIMYANNWANLNVTFKAYIKTRENIDREIHLCVHELYPRSESNNEIKNSVWSPKYKLTNDWGYFELTCNRQYHTQIRCEIYWSDSNAIDIICRDIEVSYTSK